MPTARRYAREIAMLKTRLAEKDAQLMGGFGALSNLQLGGSRGWLGDLPDPEQILASLPDQARPYIHTHPLPPRQTAWGVQGSLLSGHVPSPKGSFSLGPLGLPQKVDQAIFSSNSAILAKMSRNYLSNQQPGLTIGKGTGLEFDRRAGPTVGSPRVSQETQGSPRKPNQARPILLPLSTSQNQLQMPASQSLAGTANSFLADSLLSPVDLTEAASGPAARLTNTGSSSASGRIKAAPGSASLPQKLSTAKGPFDDDSTSEEDSGSGSESESYSDSGSEASGRAASFKIPLSQNVSQQGRTDQSQRAAVQQESRSLDSAQSSTSAQSLQDDSNEALVGQQKQVITDGFQSTAALMDSVLGNKSKQKWQMFG